MKKEKQISNLNNLINYIIDVVGESCIEEHHIEMFEGVDETIKYLQDSAEKNKKQSVNISKLKEIVNGFIDYLDSDLTEEEKYLKQRAKQVLKDIEY